MKTIETIQTGAVGAAIAFLSLFGLNALSEIQAKTDTSLWAALAGAVYFGALYFVVLVVGCTLGQNWRRILIRGFIYGVFGGMLGQVMASLAKTNGDELVREIVATPLCGLLITLLFLGSNRHMALVSLAAAIALVFFIVGVRGNLFSIIMASLISVGVWLISPLIPKMLMEPKKVNREQ